MKKNLRKIVSLVLVLVMTLAISVPAFADDSLNSDKTLVKDSSVSGYQSLLSYISQDDAITLANQCITNQIGIDNHCNWNDTTKINESVSLFDFSNNVNAYLFRLMTNGKKSGYVLVNAYVKSPAVEAFGYDCDFMLDVMNLQNTGKKVTTDNHIILADDFTFLKQDKTSGKYKNLEKNSFINDNEQILIENYNQKLQSKIDATAQANLLSKKTNTLTSNQVIYNQHDLAGIWSSGYQIYVTGDFTGYQNHCAPTAGTNLMYYWSHYGSPKEPNLWTGGVFADLYKDMNTNASSGTDNYDVLTGLDQFASSRNSSVAGSSFDGNDWDTLTIKLTNNIPIIVTLYNDSKYGNHSILAVGYQDTSTGQYIRVADGWNKTFSNFYKFSSPITHEISVWW